MKSFLPPFSRLLSILLFESTLFLSFLTLLIFLSFLLLKTFLFRYANLESTRIMIQFHESTWERVVETHTQGR